MRASDAPRRGPSGRARRTRGRPASSRGRPARRPGPGAADRALSLRRLTRAERSDLGAIAAGVHRAPLAALVLRSIEEDRRAAGIVTDPEPFPSAVELGEEGRAED